MRLLALGLVVILVVLSSSCLCSERPSPEHARTATVAGEERVPAPSPTPSPGLPSDCPHVPLGGFYDVWRDEQVWPRLGCAVAPAEAVSGTEAYLCDGTHSLWLREKELFVAIPVLRRPWAFVADASALPPDTPLMAAPTPPAEPCFSGSGRHGWLAGVLDPEAGRGRWARTSETTFSGAIQAFKGGWLLWNGNVCFVLFADSTWTMF